jgi:hypothetical protein
VLELYYQDPRFGFFLIRLVSEIAYQDHAIGRPAGALA